jgi:hypothetical protein
MTLLSKSISLTEHFVDRTFRRQIFVDKHFVDRTLRRQDILSTEYFSSVKVVNSSTRFPPSPSLARFKSWIVWNLKKFKTLNNSSTSACLCRQKNFDEVFVDEMLCRRNVVSTKKFRQNACRRSAVLTKCRVDENFSTIICRQKFVDQQHIYPFFK